MNHSFLTPISETSPTGPDLSFSPEFDRIAEMRRADDPTLDQGEWVRDLKSADHNGVITLCSELLATRTKDLRLAGWLSDAWAHTEGFAGLAQGLNLCARLCEAFWGEVHPQSDPDASGDAPAERFEQRIGTLTWLLHQVDEIAQMSPLLAIPGVQAQSLGQGRTQTRAQGSVLGRRVIDGIRARKGSEEAHTLEPTEEQLTLAIQQTPGEQIVDTLDALDRNLNALALLHTVVYGHLGVDGPNFSVARESLHSTKHLLARVAKDRGLLNVSGAAGQEPTTHRANTTAAAGQNLVAAVEGPIQSRAQALAQLRAVAEFFRRTEPHSPVAYLADKAAHWGEVPLHQWLRSVMKDPGALAHIEELLGVEPPASTSNGD